MTLEEGNIVSVRAQRINDITNVSSTNIKDVSVLSSYNDKSHIYEQQAESHAATSKHYADVAMQYAENSKKAEIWAEGTDEEVKALGGTHSAKTWTEILAGGTGGQWGTIIGNINNQTDLMTALNDKVDYSYLDELVTGFESSLDNKVDTDVFEGAVGSFSEAIENIEEKIYEKQNILIAGDNITIKNNVISAKSGDKLYDKITNCILKASGEVSIIGNMVSTPIDIKALIPKGRNADGTLKNIEWENQTGILAEVSFYGDGNHLIYKPDTDQLLHSNFLGSFTEEPPINGSNGTYYNITENKIYLNGTTHWYETNIVFLAELMTADNEVTHLKSKKPIRLVDYNDFEKLDALPHIVQTYSNGTSWYRIYSDGWCEQGGNVAKGSSLAAGASWSVTISLLVPFVNTDYFIDLDYGYGGAAGQEYRYQAKTESSFQASMYNRNDKTTLDSTLELNWQVKGYIR